MDNIYWVVYIKEHHSKNGQIWRIGSIRKFENHTPNKDFDSIVKRFETFESAEKYSKEILNSNYIIQ